MRKGSSTIDRRALAWRAASLEMEFPGNNYRSESSGDWCRIEFNYSFVWLLVVTALRAAVCREDCNNAEALFCPVFSYTSKNIALFANSQGAPACPSYKSCIFHEHVSRALVEWHSQKESKVQGGKPLPFQLCFTYILRSGHFLLVENILRFDYQEPSG